MIETALIGGGVVLGLACLTDPKKAIGFTVSIITIRGMTFLAKKITEEINPQASLVINFCGWCLAGIPIVALLKLSTGGIQEVVDSFNKIGEEINNIGMFIEKLKFW